MEEVVVSIEETKSLAGRLSKNLKSGDILALYGDLGTGKTTFTTFLVEALGIKAKVQSPSFVLARVYERKPNDKLAEKQNSPMPGKDEAKKQSINRVNHLDLYRLKTLDEAKNLGLEEYFSQPNSVTVIEWPKIAESLLPPKAKRIVFEDLGDSKRRIYFK